MEERTCVQCGKTVPESAWDEDFKLCVDCAIEYTQESFDLQETQCVKCKKNLVMVYFSPFNDCYFFHCTKCPKKVEIDLYDPVLTEINDKYDLDENYEESINDYTKEIESRLKPCLCGGEFQKDAPRRCIYCSEIIAGATSDRNILPLNKNESISHLFIKENIWK
jgi:hypothetical protein